MEGYTSERTRTAIRKLLDLAPKTARLIRDGREVTVQATEIQPGEIFLVRPGEGLATDGIIREGNGALDEAAVTGESVPVEKGPGSNVFAGSINRTGALHVEATKRFADNTLSMIIHMVEEAQERKSKTQLFIDRFGRWYSPAVLLTALTLLLVGALGGGGRSWSVRAIALLVAAAPCALVMSTPVAVAATIGRAGRRGVLIKGGMALEALGRVRVVALDKTGTLTRGEPTVTDILAINGHAASEVLHLAASVEHLSEHPLARAIVRRAEADGVQLAPAQGFAARPGAGAEAVVAGATVAVGSPASFASEGISLAALQEDIEGLTEQGKTVVVVRRGSDVLGGLALRDEPRADAAAAIDALHSLGIRVAMLTGDNRRTAEAVGKALGIDMVHAELKPQDKVLMIERLGTEIGTVAMVGDGINDAPALAAASVGIAMGTAGTDAALEAADVALMADDLVKVQYAIRLGRQARRITSQNVAFSIVLLAVLIPGALLGILSVGTAVLAHEVSELLAVANGTRSGRVT